MYAEKRNVTVRGNDRQASTTSASAASDVRPFQLDKLFRHSSIAAVTGQSDDEQLKNRFIFDLASNPFQLAPGLFRAS